MTTLLTNSDASRIDHLFAAVIGFCADFCAGARQGSYPPSPPSSLAGRLR
jgi:hypothetical protein